MMKALAFVPVRDVARLAVNALVAEAELTPKPALVDRRGSGAHRDLDLATLLASARALEPMFAAIADVCAGRQVSQELRAELGRIGRAGEVAMLRATNGANSHRGAIWCLGLLVAGAALSPENPVATATELARLPDGPAMPSSSHGSLACARYGVEGARGEARSGFPHVVAVGLPALRSARQHASEDQARLQALLAIMTTLDDTCLLHRAGIPGLRAAKDGARRVLAGTLTLAELDRRLVALNASPGGAADLLAATLFLDSFAWKS